MLQKSRKMTILMLAILVAYSIIANYSLVGYGYLYYFIVNPLFWLIYICFIRLVCSKVTSNSLLDKVILEYTLIASFIYIGTYLVSELFVEIGQNPYVFTISGIIINFFVYILPIITKEYVRFRLINNVYEKNKKKMAIFITIIFIILDVGKIESFEIFSFIKILFATILPAITINIMCTCIAYNKLWKQAVLYRVITFAFWLIFPILPKDTWMLSAGIDTVIPITTAVYIEFYKAQKELSKNKKDVEVTDPKGVIVAVIIIITILWFTLGVFPIRPIAIATRKYGTFYYGRGCCNIKKM